MTLGQVCDGLTYSRSKAEDIQLKAAHLTLDHSETQGMPGNFSASKS